MKTTLILLIVLFEMTSRPQAANTWPTLSVTDRVINDSDWEQSLGKFRDAISKRDKPTVKTFFEFPILNPGNDIWLVADMRYAREIDSRNIVPFQESDFDKYYPSILSMDFRKTFEKIDIPKLARDSLAETTELTVVSPATSKMRAIYSKTEKTVTLSLITKSPEFGRFTIDYHFKILANGSIRFTHVKFTI